MLQPDVWCSWASLLTLENGRDRSIESSPQIKADFDLSSQGLETRLNQDGVNRIVWMQRATSPSLAPSLTPSLILIPTKSLAHIPYPKSSSSSSSLSANS